jgi:hypothetical protein
MEGDTEVIWAISEDSSEDSVGKDSVKGRFIFSFTRTGPALCGICACRGS